jgi:hypothetical protein
MLNDTSMAKMTVALDVGSGMVAKGLDAASSARAMAAKSSAGGRWRRQRPPLSMACLTMSRFA